MSNTNNTDENLKQEAPQLNIEEMNTRKLQAYAVIIIAVIALFFFLFSFLKSDKEEEQVEKAQIGTQVKKANLGFKEEVPNEKQTFKELVLNEPVPDSNQMQEQSPFSPEVKPVKSTPIELKVFKGASPVMAGSSSKGGNELAAGNNAAPIDFTDTDRYTFDENGKLIEKQPKGNPELGLDSDKSFAGETFTPTAAKVSKFDPNLLLAKGSYIGCSLDTKLVSSIKGGIVCTVSDNVYSSNGATLLIEKGSKITGFFQSGQMNDGLDRIFVVWQEIRTPNHINIPVFSGASDSLGASGIEGWVDHHWLERFGSAILLSVIDDALNVAVNGKRGSSNVDYTENSRETTRNMADTALQKFINIQPTLYKNQGDLVGVYVNRDIDFSKVYKLKRKLKNGR
ncbi:type IV secretion system protein VirB10 [Campylobacter fetus]|uniref:type IV secretion system protein VirB10 n=1 Tax=Campylobacter fetus TaxID=196 RepID=UPI0003E35F62|nr:type IV secretion system protein VirB10 [Campylobacter fetus]CDF65946.1 inner membrane protein forms channel for type iv secretion of t-dna complex (virb10) [Campylobacter fetus subsp. venerealis str. 84-112]